MKKKLNFIISLSLVLAIAVSAFVTPASSFEHTEVTSSYAMLLINLDTNTTAYAQKADKYWYAPGMAELMTFILLTEKVKDPAGVKVAVDEDFIAELDYSDNCLERYLGDELTLKDLAAIMMMTTGSDAANLIADTVSGGDTAAFVSEMNSRAAELGCKLTSFLSPGYSASKKHYTTCEDIAVMYRHLMNDAMFQEIMSSPTYIPEEYGDNEEYAVTTDNSILNPVSPYYFRYATGGKYTFDKVYGASIVVTTSYKEMNYLFVALRGKNKAEENVFADARRMTTWAYLNLSDRKVINTDTAVNTAKAVTSWGTYDISLYADNSAIKTLPNEYERDKFSVKMDIPEELKLPLFEGESVGSADISYDKELLDNVSIIPNHDEGVSLLNDLGRFSGYALAKLFPNMPSEAEEQSATEPSAKPATEAATKSPKKQTSTTPAAAKATQAPTTDSETGE